MDRAAAAVAPAASGGHANVDALHGSAPALIPNQRARQLAPNSALSARDATSGSWRVPVEVVPEKNSTPTRPVRPPSKSM
jgi:hypothetical protein